MWYSMLIQPVVGAMGELGFKANEDPDGGSMTGVMNIARAVDRSTGICQHAGVAYLELTVGWRNISVLVGACATKVVFLAAAYRDLMATGVEYDANGVRYTTHTAFSSIPLGHRSTITTSRVDKTRTGSLVDILTASRSGSFCGCQSSS